MNRKITIGLALVAIGCALFVIGTVLRSDAITNSFSFGFGTPGVNGPVGSHTPTLGSATLPPGVAGQRCRVHVQMNNNESVHIGSQLVLTSGNLAPLILDDVEATPNASPSFDITLTVASSMEVYGVLGEDPVDHSGGFSGGGSITLACDVPDTTTTTSTSTPPTTVPPVVVLIPKLAG